MADRSPFDELVVRMDSAMVVVTVAGVGSSDGCLVGFHSQASIDPARYVVWLSQANRTHRLASDLAATHLGVHVLTAGDHDLAAHFGGQTGDEVDKLAAVAWTAGPGGVPLLDRLPSRFVGRVLDRVRVASTDHTAFVLEPERADLGPAVAPFRLAAAGDIDPATPRSLVAVDQGTYDVLRGYADGWLVGSPTLFDTYADDCTFHYSGTTDLAGSHVGKDACLTAMITARTRARSELLEVVDVLAGEVFGALVVRERLERDDEAHEVVRTLRFRVAHGHIAECWLLDADQRLIDHLWRA